MSFWLLVGTPSGARNSSRCLIQLVVLNEATLLQPLQTLALHKLQITVLLFIVSWVKYAHAKKIVSYSTALLLYYQLNHADCLKLPRSMFKLQIGIWITDMVTWWLMSVQYPINKLCWSQNWFLYQIFLLGCYYEHVSTRNLLLIKMEKGARKRKANVHNLSWLTLLILKKGAKQGAYLNN